MSELKLVALDEEDLKVVSAHCQDALLKTGDITYFPDQKRLVVAMNRFVWDKKTGFFRRDLERRRAALHFDRVMGVKLSGIDRTRPDDVHELLAIRFAAGEAPAGTIELTFSGSAAIRLEVECVEARLADLGAAWSTTSQPRHAL